MKNKHYDLIGDIHGHHDKLTTLLAKMGYKAHGDSHRHPEGRKVVFLGDYIDRGPKIREVLLTIRAMVEAGDALAIMGNHEFNAICYATPDGKGSHLRVRSDKNRHQHEATVAQFEGLDAEWAAWVEWLKRLPMHLDLGGLRAVHAAWDARHLEMLSGTPLLDDRFLQAAATKGTPEYAAVEVMLKGPELTLPEGVLLEDKVGIKRKTARVRWWDLAEGDAIGKLVMPEPLDELMEIVAAEMLRDLPNYGSEEVPVFFGHYWMPPMKAKAPLRHNIACLDFGAGLDGPLVAYRWDGERELRDDKFMITNLHNP